MTDWRAMLCVLALWMGGVIAVALLVFGTLALFAASGALKDALFVGGLLLALGFVGAGIRLATGGADDL